VNNALNAIADTVKPCSKGWCVNIIGEKNLEYEVDENFCEVVRLLTALGIPVNLRFLRDCSMTDVHRLGAARLNILRDDELDPVGEHLERRFGTPYISSYPVGFAGTIGFLESVAECFEIPSLGAVRAEKALQQDIIAGFKDVTGSLVTFDPALALSDSFRIACDVADRIGITTDPDGCRIPLELSPPVGTTGILRMLHRWRRAIRA
jgi:hypothetical protein